MTNKKILMLISLLLFLFLLVGCFPKPTPSNEAPIITSDPITTATVGEAYTYDVNATDPDDDTLTYSLTVKPTGMIINSATGLIKWTPTAKGNYDVVVKVSDGALDIIQSFTIVVSKPGAPPCPPAPPAFNHAPIITSIPGDTAIVGVKYIYTIKATDQDGDALTHSFVSGPVGMTFVAPTISWEPTEGQVGAHDVKVKVSDGKKETSQSFTITVEAVKLIGIEVEPDTMILLLPGEPQPFTVTAHYSYGTPVDITSDCTHLSSDSGVAIVDVPGFVTAVGPGIATITIFYTPDGIAWADIIEVTVSKCVGSYSYSWTTSIMNSTDFDFTVGMGWLGPYPWPPNPYYFFHPDETPPGYPGPIGGAWLFENIDFGITSEGQTFSVTSVADDPDFEGFTNLLTNGTDEVIWFGFTGDRDKIASAGGQKGVQESLVFSGTDVGTDFPGWGIQSVSLTFNQIYLDPANVNKLVLDFTIDIYAVPPAL